MAALPPAVTIHDRAGGCAALRPGLPVTLLSGPGAALYAGAAWWRALIGEVAQACPGARFTDLLDCADAPGLAAQALRLGQPALVFSHPEPALRAEIAARAAATGALLLPEAPPALDLAGRGAERRLRAWLTASGGAEAGGRAPPG
ncbi:hypothetical protein [Acidisoma sp. C75]